MPIWLLMKVWVPAQTAGIFTQTVGTAPNRQFIIRWKANYFNSPPGPAQAEFEYD